MGNPLSECSCKVLDLPSGGVLILYNYMHRKLLQRFNSIHQSDALSCYIYASYRGLMQENAFPAVLCSFSCLQPAFIREIPDKRLEFLIHCMRPFGSVA